MDYSMLKGKEQQLKKLADSKDGEKVKGMIDTDKLQKALDEGDTQTLQSALSQVLSTQEGARLIHQLEQLFK